MHSLRINSCNLFFEIASSFFLSIINECIAKREKIYEVFDPEEVFFHFIFNGETKAAVKANIQDVEFLTKK